MSILPTRILGIPLRPPWIGMVHFPILSLVLFYLVPLDFGHIHLHSQTWPTRYSHAPVAVRQHASLQHVVLYMMVMAVDRMSQIGQGRGDVQHRAEPNASFEAAVHSQTQSDNTNFQEEAWRR